MSKNEQLSVRKLKLDLSNYRILPQKSEATAIHALIALAPDKFWAVCKSLVEDGYLATENIIVLREGGKDIVKEGNRRIAALKLLLGYVKSSDIDLPSELTKLPAGWKTRNRTVPCLVYGPSDRAVVDKIVSLTHGKAQTAARLKWNAVATARHNRDESGASEPALDLLEKYLKHGKTVSPEQRERWGGEYPLSVLDEAMKRLASRCDVASATELANQYPKGIKRRSQLDKVLRDIGLGVLKFPQLRGEPEFGETDYGFPPAPAKTTKTAKKKQSTKKATSKKAAKKKAVSVTDSRSVSQVLRAFVPVGKNRDKVVTLLDEVRKLKLRDHPIAFCFLLRSMFELSAKAYCKDHRISAKAKNGNDKELRTLLRDACNHLTSNKSDKAMVKELHGAMTELGNSDGLLSVTSMNQLVHHPTFTLDESHICVVFNNVFPLLHAMNS